MGRDSPLLEEELMSTKENPIERYWQILVVMTTLIFGGGIVYSQMIGLANAQEENAKEIKELADKENEIEKDIISIQADIETNTDDIKEIKDELKDQSDKLDQILEKVSKE